MKANMLEIAVVLISTAIEHTLNINYRFLMRLRHFSDENITEMIKNSNFRSKVGWLMPLVFQMELEPELKKNLMKFIDLRNAIVHYKAVPFDLTDDDKCSSESIKIIIEGLDFDFFELPEKLDKSLRAQILKLNPELKLVEDLMNTLSDHEEYKLWPDL
jgi:hypothetical protein